MGIATLSLLTRNIQPSEPASPPRTLNRTHRRASQARTQTYSANMKIRLTSETDVKLHSPKQKQTFLSRPPGVRQNKKSPSHLPAALPMFFWRREWDSNPRGPNGPQALKANAPLDRNCAFGPTQTG